MDEATLTATDLLVGEIEYPDGLVIQTVTSPPWLTDMSDTLSVHVVPLPVSVPFVAPVTDRLLAVSPVIDVLNVKVN